MPLKRDLLHVVGRLRRDLDGDASLDTLARRAGWSPFHLQRVFTRVVGETPKQYALRLRLEGAAARLVSTDESICDIALAAGFASHEVFTRAFRRHFGQSPTRYRRTALRGAASDVRARHRSLIDSAGPCVGLFHTTIYSSHRRHTMPTLSIDRRELAEQPILSVRSRAGPTRSRTPSLTDWARHSLMRRRADSRSRVARSRAITRRARDCSTWKLESRCARRRRGRVM